MTTIYCFYQWWESNLIRYVWISICNDLASWSFEFWANVTHVYYSTFSVSQRTSDCPLPQRSLLSTWVWLNPTLFFNCKLIVLKVSLFIWYFFTLAVWEVKAVLLTLSTETIVSGFEISRCQNCYLGVIVCFL